MNRPLSDKQQRFIHEYLIDQNARQAALRAGYSPGTQGGAAADLMKDPRIKATICKGLGALFEKLDITAERLMMERARIAFFDPGKLFDANGRLIPLMDLAPGVLAALNLSYDLKNGEVTVIRVRPPNRNPALNALEKMLTRFEALRRGTDEPEEEQVPGEAEPVPAPIAAAPEPVAAAPALVAATSALAPTPPHLYSDRPMRRIRNLTLEGKPIPGYPADQEFIWVPDGRPVGALESQPAAPAPTPGLLKGAAKRVQQAFSRAA